MRSLILASATLAGLTACADRENPAPSAAAPAWSMDTVWTLASDQIVRIGRVALSDRWVLFDAGPQTVLAAPIGGTSTVRVGRAGRGPGEFESFIDLALRGDSAYVLDGVQGRLHRFILSDGARVDSTWRLPNMRGDPTRVFVRGDSIFVAFTGRAAAPSTVPAMTVLRDTVLMVGLGKGDDTARVIGSFPGREYMYYLDSGRRGRAWPAFGTTTHFEMTEAGAALADGRTGAVSLQSWGGATRVLIAGSATDDRSVSQLEMESLMQSVQRTAERLRARGSGEAEAHLNAARSMIDVWKGPPPRPYYEAMVSDGRTLAMQSFAWGSPDTVTFDVVAVDGTRLGEWRLSRLRISAIKGDTLIGVARDSLDVESLVLLRATRGGPMKPQDRPE